MSSFRLRFERVGVSYPATDRCQVTVACSHNGNVFQAGSEGNVAQQSEVWLAAEATLALIERFTVGQLRCTLEQMERTRMLGLDVLVLLVRLEYDGSRVQLFGSCRIKPDDPDLPGVGVRATLDAVNRYIELVGSRTAPSLAP